MRFSASVHYLHHGTVYNNLSHPPAMYIGPEYQYRRADGSYNTTFVTRYGQGRYALCSQLVSCSIPAQAPKGQIFSSSHTYSSSVLFLSSTGTPLNCPVWCFCSPHLSSICKPDNHYMILSALSMFWLLLYNTAAPLYRNTMKRLKRSTFMMIMAWSNPDTFAEDHLMLLPPAICVLLVVQSELRMYVFEAHN